MFVKMGEGFVNPAIVMLIEPRPAGYGKPDRVVIQQARGPLTVIHCESWDDARAFASRLRKEVDSALVGDEDVEAVIAMLQRQILLLERQCMAMAGGRSADAADGVSG
jgi:hypothetical protein